MQWDAFTDHRYETTLLTCTDFFAGNRRGDDVLLPRIFCDSNDVNLPIQIRRKQFPVQVCFAMTINKAQGQSLHHLGLYLPSDVLAYGQLYVTLS